MQLLKISLAFLALLAAMSLPPAGAAASERRLALVIGNGSYKAKALATPVNDAALIAQTLQTAGFDVMGARDLDEDLLRQTFRDFTDSVANAGPDTVVAVYFAGYGLQFDGENYLVPIDADITEASDVPVRALQLSEQIRALTALHLKTSFIILDVARANAFILPGQACGLAWVEPEANMLIAFNAAPGTVAPVAAEGYGPYAKALAEMIREGSLTPANVFDRVRLRVNELTKGAQVPWDASKIETQFKFFERAPGAPLRADSPERTARMRSESMRSFGAHDAYLVALVRDTFDGYADFLADYWHDPMTKRVRALLAARREAITWRRTYQANVPDAYWSYLERYPRGPHVADARRLLTHLGATIEPPPKFARMDYEVPPPLPDELEYIERTVLVFDDPAFAFEPPQPSPVNFLEPSPAEFRDWMPPAAVSGGYILPTLLSVPLPVYVSVPADVVAPPEALIVNSARLPPSVAAKATLINSRSSSPPAVNPVVSARIKAPLNPPSPTVSLTPPWPTDNKIPGNAGIQPPTLATDSEMSIPAPTMLALPSTGMPLRTRRNTMPSSQATESLPLPTPRSEALAPPRTPRAPASSPQTTGSTPPSIPRSVALAPPRTPRAATRSPQTTGNIPSSPARSVTLAPPPTRSLSKPITNAASTSPPVRTDQAKHPKTPPLNRLAPSTQVVNTSKDSPEESPPKP
jgi:uncharacterized caspase-like protein